MKRLTDFNILLLLLVAGLMAVIVAHTVQAQSSSLSGILKCDSATTWEMDDNRLLLDGHGCRLLLDDFQVILSADNVEVGE